MLYLRIDYLYKKNPDRTIYLCLAFAANKMVTDEKVISNLANTLIDKITMAVLEMGIKAELKVCFHRAAYCVIKVCIKDIDKLTLILAAKGTEFASAFTGLLASLNVLGLSDSVVPGIDERILKQVHTSMMAKFAEIIPQKMGDSGLNVECNVCSSAEQADHFFSTLDILGSP